MLWRQWRWWYTQVEEQGVSCMSIRKDSFKGPPQFTTFVTRKSENTIISSTALCYHEIASSVGESNELLWKDDALKHSNSRSYFVNAKLSESVSFASGTQPALSLWRQRLTVRRVQQNNTSVTQHSLRTRTVLLLYIIHRTYTHAKVSSTS